MNRRNTRVVLVETSFTLQAQMKEAIDRISGMELVFSAPTSKLGLEKALADPPNIVIVGTHPTDRSMISMVRSLALSLPETAVLVLAGKSEAEAALAMEALSYGAFDLLPKPSGHGRYESVDLLVRKLLPKLKMCSMAVHARIAKNLLQNRDNSRPKSPNRSATTGQTRAIQRATKTVVRPFTLHHSKKLVVVGASTGGPDVLMRILPDLSADFPLPIVVVVHLPKRFTTALAKSLDQKSSLRVMEAIDGQPIESQTVYIAPGRLHTIIKNGTENTLCLNTLDTPPVLGCKPAADILFESAAKTCGKHALAVILTGMGRDGTAGLAHLNQQGAHIIAQDKESSVVWGMPGSAVDSGVVNEVLPASKIARRLTEIA
ncbi:MAG: chemotaxis protein CheB [Myxococcota bacterium]|nr:chemotaxis protein CheB [Myxococcota bacterium]